ncbi:hypothetical protein EI42_00374 [Thermosporothrix hazakensis]|jgi:heme-degrading monooxygenase HmoA|uniref:ABM domain-containing protein n=1 Tax=Thermosporothrix hazakensis TaxID=644383 RepID=A0A326UC53_THEHA|nr:antibiotic biosynthesis monooxygenase [Thermosporothrix hazakensis]PZW36202.1 hypothetical protein EI42_00374 [Thermosporothrix hazakensis]GCE46852.1 hypothetical protein KTH_17210 [Thermosporothrix hazakensis]
MELLVVTMAYVASGTEAESEMRLRLVNETIRNAPGLLTLQSYYGQGRGNEKGSIYVLLTSWDDEESWFDLQERYNPKKALQTTVGELLKAPPYQWLMYYQWGYSRSTAQIKTAALHLIQARAEYGQSLQQEAISALQNEELQMLLAFAFLARGIPEENRTEKTIAQGAVHLHFLSWGSESEREHFLATPRYQQMHAHINRRGAAYLLPLTPLT